jgi:hypothetical protein
MGRLLQWPVTNIQCQCGSQDHQKACLHVAIVQTGSSVLIWFFLGSLHCPLFADIMLYDMKSNTTLFITDSFLNSLRVDLNLWVWRNSQYSSS